MSAIKEHYHGQIEAAQRGKARPILFSAPMIRAILDGRKSQTRRIIKPQPRQIDGGWQYGKKYQNHAFGAAATPATDIFYPYQCPYGQPGDHLWVRETWQKFGKEYAYAATDGDVFSETKWRPSIHMPRDASRITLQITDIRAERLHDITESDAIDEGINFTTQNGGPNKYYDNYHTGRWMDSEMLNNPIASYRTLWETINGPGSWEQNPWVWVIEFSKT